jgi:hypothetical protein
MSTRCQIAFYEKDEKNLNNFETLIYKHHDGYPENMIPLLLPFLQKFNKERGLSDIEYASARLLQYMCNESDKSNEEFRKIYKMINGADFLGYGICKDFHGDIEYLYAIYPDSLIVYDINFTADEDDINNKNHILENINIY